jgi:hypothetical protein
MRTLFEVRTLFKFFALCAQTFVADLVSWSAIFANPVVM